MKYGDLLRAELSRPAKAKPVSTVSFDVAKPSDGEMAMIQLYDEGADRERILRRERKVSPSAAESPPIPLS